MSRQFVLAQSRIGAACLLHDDTHGGDLRGAVLSLGRAYGKGFEGARGLPGLAGDVERGAAHRASRRKNEGGPA
jgi:hypothetical protein